MPDPMIEQPKRTQIRCENCTYFQPLAHDKIENTGGGCHYNPPTMPGGFPLVSKNDWCRCFNPSPALLAKLKEAAPDED